MESQAVPPIVSRLAEPAQRFLSRVLEHGFASGLRFPEEFMRSFDARELMVALGEHPTRRARILEVTVGLRPRVALRKSPESAAEDLQIALDEGETDAATVLKLFEPDDRVQFLDNQRLWSFEVEPRFWTAPESLGDRLGLVREHTAFVVSCGIDEGLITATDVVNAISVSTLVERLSGGGVASLLERALMEGRNGTPFSDATLLDAIGLDQLVELVPLATIWDWVVNAKIAATAGLLGDSDLLFDEAEAHPDASSDPVDFADEPKTAEL